MSTWARATNENLRASDADRDHVAERLREHYAAGRLTSGELDERLSATLGARTIGDLRAQLTDLPEPELAGPPMQPQPLAGPLPGQWGGRPLYVYRRGPRLVPLLLVIVFAGMLLHGGGLAAAAFLPFVFMLPVLVVMVMVLTGLRWRHRMRRQWQDGRGSWPGQPPRDWWQR